MPCPPSTLNCGCLYPSDTSCVFMRGISGNCLGIINGDTLTSAVNKMVTAICNGVTPSGITHTVVTAGTGILVTSNTVGTTTTYTVGLTSTIVNQINSNTTNIATLTACVSNGVHNIVSDTLTVTTDSTSGCGNILRVEYNPSGVPSYDGIVENNFTGYGPDGGGGLQVVFTNNHQDFTNLNGLTIGDEIVFRVSGEQASNDVLVTNDIPYFRIYNGATQKFSIGDGLYITLPYKIGYYLEIRLTVTGADSAYITGVWNRNLAYNGLESVGGTSVPRSIFNKSVSGLDFSALKVQMEFQNDSQLNITYNNVKLFTAEVIKKV